MKRTYKVNGMSCASCVRSVETMLNAQNGINNASVNLAENSVVVDFDNGVIKAKGIKQVVDGIGFELLLEEEDEGESERRSLILKYKIFVAIGLAVPVMLISMVFKSIPYREWVLLVLSTPVLFWSGSHFFINAAKKLKHGSSNMDTLVSLGTGVAFSYSLLLTVFPSFFETKGIDTHVYYESAVVVIALVLLGNYLENRAKSNTSEAIKKLAGLQVKEALIIENGIERHIPIEKVKVDDILKIKPGEKIPIDGFVVKGDSFIDESMISGEPLAVKKTANAKLIGGTINQSGILEMQATQVGLDTMLSQIIAFVKDAQISKAPIQNLVDKIASIFVPIVVSIALLTFGVWYLLGPSPQFTHALISMVTVLVIACPCALGLATPTAIIVGMGKGAQKGILIKNAVSLEQFHKIDTLVLDKTGTITEGKPTVNHFHNFGEKEIENIIYSIEKHSEHPLAKAVCSYFENIKNFEIEKFNNISGKGVQAKINNTSYLLGNKKLLDENGILLSENQIAIYSKLEKEGNTLVLLSNTKECLAILGIDDKIKADALKTIISFQQKGIDVVMLTGDNQVVAEMKAKQVGITTVIGNVLPTEKALTIKKIQAEGKKVAMVGDGINDAPALAQADISIAMGTGTDISIETAQVVVLKGDLSKVFEAYELSNQTVKTIKQNLFWAFIYNLIGIPIAAGVLYPYNGFLLNPMFAGGAMAFSSVSVVLNSLRLKK